MYSIQINRERMKKKPKLKIRPGAHAGALLGGNL